MSQGSERILILAPYGRDAVLLERVLNDRQIEVGICATFECFCDAIAVGAGALLIADEALNAVSIESLAQVLNQQPEWSDINLLVMTSGGEATLASARRLELLEPIHGPTTLLERPLRAVTLLSAVGSALRARRRQYQVRDLLEHEKQAALALRQANDALNRSNDSLAEFAFVVSHDLQEPLRTITSYSQLLSRRYKDHFDKQGKDYFHMVIGAALRMSRLIDDLLSYSRVTEEADVSSVQSDCNAVVEIVKDNLNALIQETGADVSASHLPAVAADSRQMVQLLQNLIANAIKYRRPDVTPCVHIDAQRENSFWRFRVSDNGIGFDQEHADEIFGVFKRLHRNDEAGTGIGLAICRRVVEHYGGRIWAHSSVGNGATFFFLVPAVDSLPH